MGLLDYFRRRSAPFISPFDPEDEEARRLLEAVTYTRPRRTDMMQRTESPLLPETRPLPAFGLAASRTVSPPAPAVYTRSRRVEEPADELTKLAETRDYHANQRITNDDPWWKNLLKGGLAGVASGPSRDPGELVGRFLGGAGVNLAAPALDDRMENQAEVAKLDDRYAREYGRQKGALGLEGLKADVEYKRMKPSIEDARVGALERRLDLTDVYNRGRLEESAANRGVRVSEGEKNREVKVSEGDKNRTVRSAVAENNLKFRKEKDVADRELRKGQHSDRMRVAQAALAERVKARVAQEAARALAAGQRAKATKISEAKARIWAKSEGADWDDFVSALDDNGIEITEK